MNNIKDLRKDLDSFKKKLKYRNVDFDIEKFSKLDKLKYGKGAKFSTSFKY